MGYKPTMILHPASMTYLDINECVFVDDDMADCIDDGIPAPDTDGILGAGIVWQEYARMNGWSA